MSFLQFSVSRLISPTVYPHRHRRVKACANVEVHTPNSVKKAVGVSKELMEAEGRVLVGTYARAPAVFSSSKGCKLYNPEGREYLDLSSGIGVNAFGHGNPDWVRVVMEQAGMLTHVSNAYYAIPQVRTMKQVLKNPPAVELTKRIVDCTTFADRVFFCNTGTEANEAAIKFARRFQRFTHPEAEQPQIEFISFRNSFHGRTVGSLALTSKGHYRSPFEPLMPGVTFLEYGNIEAATQLIQRRKIAASARREFLYSLRRACDDSGSLLVFDEVQCGLGCTGYLWAHEAYGIVPDIMIRAKPLAGGLPIGAMLVTEKVAAAIRYRDHGSTFAGGPLVCTAALAVLEKVSSLGFLASVSNKGQYFKELLIKKLGGNSHVREVRGLGLIIGIELDVSASPLVDACQNSGLLVLTAGKGNVIRLLPPLIITEQELEHAAGILLGGIPALDKGN
ncbi:hypothetical protein I3760_01G248700 [Carya illinoinensis]|nr:hypothetical protein I3760_01G248700 [Carya illinoinensis]